VIQPDPGEKQVAAYLVQYDPEKGEVQEFFEGEMRAVTKIRVGMLEEATKHAAIRELEKLGYTVISPEAKRPSAGDR
jgi:hypothetical protein